MNVRFYGDAPCRAALVHGGPGAPGAMAPVARALFNSGIHVIELLQTQTTIQGQINELAETIRPHAPITLIGHSWGAWLACLTAAEYPDLVKKLILVSFAPFASQYAGGIMKTRISRLDPIQRAQARMYLDAWQSGTITDEAFAAFGALTEMADTYSPLPENHGDDLIPCRGEDYLGVWDEADAMRRSGALLSEASKIRCPVIAIHGHYDPHPYRGVEGPLTKAIDGFRFILLEKCGHTPWEERYARDDFFQILRDEIP